MFFDREMFGYIKCFPYLCTVKQTNMERILTSKKIVERNLSKVAQSEEEQSLDWRTMFDMAKISIN